MFLVWVILATNVEVGNFCEVYDPMKTLTFISVGEINHLYPGFPFVNNF